MLPSGLTRTTDQDGRISKIGVGLYVVEDAYEGEYDFFAPSRLYSMPEQTATPTESPISEEPREN
jgi:hypothetical protein